MKTTKITKLLAAVTLLFISACSTTTQTKEPEPTPDPIDVNVTAMKGPTAMGMSYMMDQSDNGNITSNNYHFTLLASVAEIAPAIAKKEADIACVPANLGAVLYNKTDKGVEVLAVNTLGVLYLCQTGDSVKSISDLKGKTIYSSGKGATPEYALNYVLKENGIDPETDVTIEWKSEHAECVAAMAADPEAIAMLPQPFVTAAQTKNENIKICVDLNEEWEKLANNKSALITGIVIARTEFVQEHPEAVADFLANYKTSVDYVNSNNDEAAALIGKYDIVAEAVAKKALPKCNIVYIDGSEMKDKLSGYLNVLYEQNPTAVGGTLPGDDFYYEK